MVGDPVAIRTRLQALLADIRADIDRGADERSGRAGSDKRGTSFTPSNPKQY